MTYDECIGQLHQLDEADEAVEWTRAEIVYQALQLEGVTPNRLAADRGCSASHVRRQAKTYAAFPDPAQRWNGPGASWTHHRLCAETTDPQGWLAQAMDGEWSTADLAAAIQAAKAQDPHEEARRKAEQAIQRLRAAWRDADADIRAAMKPAILAFVEAELV